MDVSNTVSMMGGFAVTEMPTQHCLRNENVFQTQSAHWRRECAFERAP